MVNASTYSTFLKIIEHCVKPIIVRISSQRAQRFSFVTKQQQTPFEYESNAKLAHIKKNF